jgi:uncharacterized protein (DUF362 family)/lauroyl/myristoyl acyltransferase/Pyruvate/2-oxoacid:ferredoxin oxidoreductase delta subunit
MENINKSQVAIEKCDNYNLNDVKSAILNALSKIVKLEDIIKKDSKVLLKVNMLSAKKPDRAITTHPIILEAMIEIVKSLNATCYVGDSPGGNISGIERYYKETGFYDVCIKHKVEMLNFEKAGSNRIKIDNPHTDHVNITKVIDDMDIIINLPKLKTHGLTFYTGAVKNLYGLVPGLSKANFHKTTPNPDDFSTILKDIYKYVKPKLTIMDAIIGMEGNGPSSGDPRKIGLILASKDAVSLDAVASYIINYEPMNIETTRLCNNENLGNGKLSNIEVISNTLLDDLRIKDFKHPANALVRKVPRWILKFFAKQLWIKPVIDKNRCVKCKFCYDNCPVKTIKINEDKTLEVDHSKCISCLCCHELCPYDAIDLEKSLLAKIIFRSSMKKEREQNYNYEKVKNHTMEEFNRLYKYAPLKHKLEFKLFDFLKNLNFEFGSKSFYRLGRAIGVFVFDILRIRRDFSINQIKETLTIKNDKIAKIIARNSYVNFAKSALEYISFEKINKSNIDNFVKIKGIKNLENALLKKKGVILATGHFGSWELLGLTLKLKGYNIDYVVGEQRNLLVNFYMNFLRAIKGIGIIKMGLSLKGVLSSLKKNHIVALLVDQDAGKEGIFIDFFNKKASTYKGASLFSLKSGAPIVPMYIVREKNNKHTLIIEKEINFNKSDNKEDDIKTITNLYTKSLENIIKKYPSMWFFAHRRFKTKIDDLK